MKPADSKTVCILFWLLGTGVFATMSSEGRAGQGDEKAPPKVTVREDVVYGRVHGAGLLADIAFPESKEPLPAIISVHGGRWVGGHKRDASTIKVEQWAGFGFFAMSIDYRLKGCSPAPACYQDFQCAIRFVHAHAKEYNIDTKRIFLIGQSAGGHMVSLAATLGDGTVSAHGRMGRGQQRLPGGDQRRGRLRPDDARLGRALDSAGGRRRCRPGAGIADHDTSRRARSRC